MTDEPEQNPGRPKPGAMQPTFRSPSDRTSPDAHVDTGEETGIWLEETEDFEMADLYGTGSTVDVIHPISHAIESTVADGFSSDEKADSHAKPDADAVQEEDKPLYAFDPFDLTGAEERYYRLLDRTTEETARRIADMVVNKFARSTLYKYTNLLGSYMAHCDDNSFHPFPADSDQLLIFLDAWSFQRIQASRALQPLTLRSFVTAIRHIHAARDVTPDPADDPVIANWLTGYARDYERLPVQAHAIRIEELALMLLTLRNSDSYRLQDEVIITLLLDPEVQLIDEVIPNSLDPKGGPARVKENPMGRSINLNQAIRLTWQGTSLPPGGTDAPTLLDIPRKNGIDVFVVPNRSGEYYAEFSDVEIELDPQLRPIAVRLCATTALTALHFRVRQETAGRPDPTGPVLRNARGRALTRTGVAGKIAKLAEAAGLVVRPAEEAYSAEERLAMLTELYSPRFEDLRDAMICTLMWWASLRRSEAALLEVDHVIPEEKNRGLWLMVMKKKGDFRGDIRIIPRHNRGDGTSRPTCAVAMMEAYLDSYARRLGRDLRPDDPLFPALDTGKPLTADWIGRRVGNIVKSSSIEAMPGERLTSHGLRAGYATEHLMRGMPAQIVAQRQGRKSVESLQGYIRPADAFEAFELVDYEDHEYEAMFDAESILMESGAPMGRQYRRRGRRGR